MLALNPYDWNFHEDPYPTYARLREEAPLHRNEALGFWALSRYADVDRAFKDCATYSSAEGVALEAFSPDAWRVASFLAMDPPRHDRMRGLVNKAFTPRRSLELEPRVREIADALLDSFREDGRCEFIAEFAGKLPMDVISDMLGVPTSERAQLREWVEDVLHRAEGEKSVPPDAQRSAAELLQYYHALVAERRARPSDDMLGDLIRAEIDGDRLSDDEIVGFLFLMGVAGNETTTKLLGNALYWAKKFPEQWEKIRRDFRLIPNWIEETLRFDNSSQIVYRTLARDVELYGRTMKAGDRVALLIGAANRDPSVFDRPDEYDIQRSCSDSLAFGRGIHFCLGANLARLEGRVCMEALFARFVDYEIDEAGLARAHSGNVRGFTRMPIRFQRA